ncbi:ArsR/SmtB family transcription factor [Haloechinothrix halophila]|uniref:ArsR/SmtB family transcription factor n=1 Tax=Haloechinothrix halophila TaxID=1069073 RepID=UPI000420A10E|nr:metalloregulator ArsR/SmtB family transcription factor [Haloechinothrix halophila]
MSNQSETTESCSPPLIAEPLTQEQATDLARTVKALADPVRLRLLSLIASHAGGEVCVCDLSGAFELSQPTISHHLKVLRQVGLVTSERRGTWVYYRADLDALRRLSTALVGDATPVVTA